MRWIFDALFGNNKRDMVFWVKCFFKMKKKLLLVTFSKIMKLRDKWKKGNNDLDIYHFKDYKLKLTEWKGDNVILFLCIFFRNNVREITFSKIMKKKSFMESFINDNERKIFMLLSIKKSVTWRAFFLN